MAILAVKQLPLAPLGGGELVDRAVRLYRRHFTALVLVATLPVMGGATRNLVAHFFWDEPVSARTTDSNAESRFWGLLASIIIGGL